MTLLRRSSLRHLWHHRWQALLAVVGVGLGVAVVLAVDLAVSSARRGFTLSAETIAGRATHQLRPGPAGLPDTAFVRIRGLPGVVAAAPVVDGQVATEETGRTPQTVLRVLGVDPFSEAPFRTYTGGSTVGQVDGEDRGADREALRGADRGAVDGPAVSPALLIGARAGLLSAGTAATLDVAPGAWLPLAVGGRRDSVRVAGLLTPADEASRLGLANLLVVDVGTAQALLGRTGLDRVDLILASEAAARAVAGALPAGATLERAGAEAGALREMTRAFDLNLRALSLLALVFGVFLIYNSVTFSVVQRRRLLGTLRALGATRGQVFGLVATEALVFGAVGALLGLGLGVALGTGLVRLVTRTIEDLYFVVAVRTLVLTPATVAKAAALGVAGTLLAALPPAYEAATTHPRSAMLRSELESGLRRRLPLVSVAGLALAAAGGAVLAASSSVDASFVGLFGVIIGAALLTPMGTVALMRLLRPLAGRLFGVLGRMAATGVTAGLSRTAPAVAALTMAVAVTIGVAVMIGSFRGSVVRWLDRTLSADVYIAPAGPGGVEPGRIDPGALARIAADPAVAEVRRYRRGTVSTAGGATPSDGAVDLMAIGLDSRLREQFDFLEGDPAVFWGDFAAGRAVVVSEPFAFRTGIGAGDSLRLRTGRGAEAIPVAGVFRDYGSDRGMVMMSEAGYRARWDDPTVTTAALILRPGADVDAAVRRIRTTTAPLQALSIRTDRRLAAASLAVFDRTFAITQVLRLLALIVAFVGVLSALMALQLERGRELGVLRANGLTPGQVWTMVASQTGLMGLASGLMAVPLGLLLSVLMVEFVNRRSFGWSIDLSVPPGVLLQAVALALAAALLAGIYPSWRMARTSPAEALRSE